MLRADRYFILVVRFAGEPYKSSPHDHQYKHQDNQQEVPGQARRIWSVGITTAYRQQYERKNDSAYQPAYERDSIESSLLRNLEVPSPIRTDSGSYQGDVREQQTAPRLAEEIPAYELCLVPLRQRCVHQHC